MIIYNKAGLEIFRSEDAGSVGQDFDSADLRDANLSHTDWSAANFSGANLADANLEGGVFYWAIFFETNLSNTNLKRTDLRGSDLKFANLRGADLTGAILKEDNLGGPTQLQGADLSDTLLDRAVFDRAQYSKDTKFPVGFDPVQHGMVRVETEPDQRL